MTSRTPTRLLLSLVVAALGLAPALLGAGPAYACSCAQLPLAEQMAAADVVAVGAVDGIEDRGRVRDVTVEVEEVVRGDADGTLRIRTASDGAACGLDFLEVGQRYAFFAARVAEGPMASDDGVPVASLCGGTTTLRPGLVEELEAAAAQAPPPSPAPDTTQDAGPDETTEPGTQVSEQAGEPADDPDAGQARRTPVLVVLVVLGTLLVAAGVVAWRRRRG